MKHLTQRLAIGILISCLGITALIGGGARQSNEYVRVESALAGNDVKAGGGGTILISFVPVDGIHINADPPVTVTIEKNRVLSLKGDPDVTVDKESEALSTSTPVEQRFTVSSKATPGEHTIKGTIIYYFCSDTEGWCRRFSQPMTLKLNIQKP